MEDAAWQPWCGLRKHSTLWLSVHESCWHPCGWVCVCCMCYLICFCFSPVGFAQKWGQTHFPRVALLVPHFTSCRRSPYLWAGHLPVRSRRHSSPHRLEWVTASDWGVSMSISHLLAESCWIDKVDLRWSKMIYQPRLMKKWPRPNISKPRRLLPPLRPCKRLQWNWLSRCQVPRPCVFLAKFPSYTCTVYICILYVASLNIVLANRAFRSAQWRDLASPDQSMRPKLGLRNLTLGITTKTADELHAQDNSFLKKVKINIIYI